MTLTDFAWHMRHQGTDQDEIRDFALDFADLFMRADVPMPDTADEWLHCFRGWQQVRELTGANRLREK